MRPKRNLSAMAMLKLVCSSAFGFLLCTCKSMFTCKEALLVQSYTPVLPMMVYSTHAALSLSLLEIELQCMSGSDHVSGYVVGLYQ